MTVLVLLILPFYVTTKSWGRMVQIPRPMSSKAIELVAAVYRYANMLLVHAVETQAAVRHYSVVSTPIQLRKPGLAARVKACEGLTRV
ncbi:hypothetical protein ARMGADRAFT_1012288 [Armillaria gallica]|uniref:Secreted protein n=1 Tax=Armillaria gallica TaxID=47427 RepID=A0A2H3DDS9_ARMGA|nr:hypothetical protein ARMGADRAFT_1012288 [Armillaria gallica]